MSEVIIHLLGYLTKRQWADALRSADTYKDMSIRVICDHLKEQDDTYGGDISGDVVDELYDKKGNSTPLRKKVAEMLGISLCPKCESQLEQTKCPNCENM